MGRGALALALFVIVLCQAQTAQWQGGHLREANRVTQNAPGGKQDRAENGPQPYGPPLLSYLRNVPYDAKREYFEILENKTLTINQQKQAILRWGSKYGLRAQVEKFNNDMTRFKEEIRENLTAVVSELADTLRTLFVLTDSEDQTPSELRRALQNFLARNPTLSCVIKSASGKSKKRQQGPNSSSAISQEPAPEFKDTPTVAEADGYNRYEGSGNQEELGLDQTSAEQSEGYDRTTLPGDMSEKEGMEMFENADASTKSERDTDEQPGAEELDEKVDGNGYNESEEKSGSEQNDRGNDGGYEDFESTGAKGEARELGNIDQYSVHPRAKSRKGNTGILSESESEEGIGGNGQNNDRIGIMRPRIMDEPSGSEQSRNLWGRYTRYWEA